MAAFDVTRYFVATPLRPDRAGIADEWMERVVRQPERVLQQGDGRLRCWAAIAEAEGRRRRVVLLEDGVTVHDAFFDRGFEP